MSDRIPVSKTDTFERYRGEADAIGPHLAETPQGDVMFIDAPGYTTALGQRADPSRSRVCMMLYDPYLNRDEPGFGMVCQMTADQARSIAASLLRLASQLDGGKAN